MELQLEVTVATINQSNRTISNDLDLFRIINYFSPRAWYFSFTFDAKHRNILGIRAQPDLTSDDIQAILNGKFSVLYRFSELNIDLGDGTLELLTRMSEVTSNRTTVTFSSTDESIGGSIRIIGFQDIDQVQRQEMLQKWFSGNTWLGSFEPPRGEVNINLFGKQIRFAPSKDIIPEGCFQKIFLLDSQPETVIRLRCSPNYSENSMRHAVYGDFSPEQIDRGFWTGLSQAGRYHSCIEISNPNVEWYTDLGPIDISYLRKVLANIREEIRSIQGTDLFQQFLARIERETHEQAAIKLTERQEKLRNSEKVWVNGNKLFKIPTNETELVSLYMKLEASQNLPAPLECEVTEYTAQQGIDALGKFRLSPQDNWNYDVPIEFENMFSSYLKHKHPGGQTKLIICWACDDGDLDQYGCEGPHNEKFLQWVNIEGHTIPVVIVSEFPQIELRV